MILIFLNLFHKALTAFKKKEKAILPTLNKVEQQLNYFTNNILTTTTTVNDDNNNIISTTSNNNNKINKENYTNNNNKIDKENSTNNNNKINKENSTNNNNKINKENSTNNNNKINKENSTNNDNPKQNLRRHLKQLEVCVALLQHQKSIWHFSFKLISADGLIKTLQRNTLQQRPL